MSHSRAWRRGRRGGAAVVACATVFFRPIGRMVGRGKFIVIVLPTFAGLKAIYDVLDPHRCLQHPYKTQGFVMTLQNDQKGCGTNFFIIMYGDEW